MNNDQREIQRKLRVLEHADKISDVSKTSNLEMGGWRSSVRANGTDVTDPAV